MKHKKIILLSLFVLSFGTKFFAQLTPSIYAGCGLGTNIGGTVGMGTEVKYKMISFNVAIGSLLGKGGLWDIAPYSEIGSSLKLDYDVGVKWYSDFGMFLGVNYGIIATSTYYKESDTAQDFPQIKPQRGFSFTLGYRHSIYKNLYGLGFVGLTSSKEQNYTSLPFRDDKFLFPRIGLILGYEFKKRKK